MRASVVAGELTRAGRVAREDGANLVQLAAIVPVVAMTMVVLRAPEVQWFDYWFVLPRVVNPDGSLAEHGLFFYYNGHVLALPSVVYWANYRLTSGLNSTLGLFVVGLGVAQVLLLRTALPTGPRAGRWTKPLLAVAITVLIFAPQGSHNFVRAMSGAAWQLAGLLAIAAILLAGRGRTWGTAAAIPLAALATVSYGTGVMTWPALLVVCLLCRPRGPSPRLVQVLLVVASAVGAGSFFWFYSRPPAYQSVRFDLTDMAHRWVQVLGSAVAAGPDTAAMFGVVTVVLTGYLSVLAVRRNPRFAAPWVGLGVFALLGAAMIGVARGGSSDDIGASSRYASLSAMCWIVVIVLAAWLWPRDQRLLLGGLVVTGCCFVSGQASLAQIQSIDLQLEELTIAVRLGVSTDFPPGLRPSWNDENVAVFRELGHYPFSDAFDADCGMLGRRLDPAEVEATGATRGYLEAFAPAYNPASVRLTGWALTTDDDQVRCVLVVGPDHQVVGAAAYGSRRPDASLAHLAPSDRVGFTAVAPAGLTAYRAVAVSDTGRLTLLDGSPAPAPRH